MYNKDIVSITKKEIGDIISNQGTKHTGNIELHPLEDKHLLWVILEKVIL